MPQQSIHDARGRANNSARSSPSSSGSVSHNSSTHSHKRGEYFHLCLCEIGEAIHEDSADVLEGPALRRGPTDRAHTRCVLRDRKPGAAEVAADSRRRAGHTDSPYGRRRGRRVAPATPRHASARRAASKMPRRKPRVSATRSKCDNSLRRCMSATRSSAISRRCTSDSGRAAGSLQRMISSAKS